MIVTPYTFSIEAKAWDVDDELVRLLGVRRRPQGIPRQTKLPFIVIRGHNLAMIDNSTIATKCQ